MVAMVGKMTIDDPDIITGHIAVHSDNEPADLTAWHAQADKLLEHVRRVMSFASASVHKGPVIEFLREMTWKWLFCRKPGRHRHLPYFSLS